MSFPQQVADAALVACGRCCCICHKFCGTKIELHHIKQVAFGGEDTFDNCIPLCFDCHADMGKADPKHNKGKRYTEDELRQHRDKWYLAKEKQEKTNFVELEPKHNHATCSVTAVSGTYLCENDHGYFTFDYSNNNGEYTIGKDDHQFTTKWSKASDKSIHAYRDARNIEAIARIKAPHILPTSLAGEFDFSSRCRTPNIGDIIIWKNVKGKFAATKIVSIADDTRGVDHDELTCEYIIYE